MTDTDRVEFLYAMRDFIAHEIELEVGPGIGAENPIVVAVSDLYDVDPALVVGDGRGHQVTKVRHGVAWLLRRQGMSLREIAACLHYSDKTAAGRAYRRIDHDAGIKALLTGLEVER